MSEKVAKPLVANNPQKPVTFTCKLCGETKPLKEMVSIRQYFPLLTSCQDCAKGKPTSMEDIPDSETSAD